MYKFFITLVWIIAVVLVIWIGVASYVPSYQYDQNVESYLKLADDASTATLKLEHLLKYRGAVVKMVLGENARFIWKVPQATKTEQMKVLNSLIERVTQTSKLKEGSFEYQTAMGQITGQEFESAIGSTNRIFFGIYARQQGWSHFMWIYYLWALIWWLVIIIVACIGTSDLLELDYNS